MKENYGRGWKDLEGTGEAPKGFCWRILRERDHLEDLAVNRRVILKSIFNEWNGRPWT